MGNTQQQTEDNNRKMKYKKGRQLKVKLNETNKCTQH